MGRNKILKLFYLFLCFCFMVGAISCTSRKEKFCIGVSQCSDDEWRRQMNREILRESNFYESVEVEIRTACDNSERQIDDIRYFVDQKKVDLLIVSPNEAEPVTSVVESVYDSGIPVVIVDRKILSDGYTAYIGADNYEIGKAAGCYIAGALQGRGSVVEITGLVGSTPAIERHRGFIDAISAYPEIRLLASEAGDWLRQTADSTMDSLLLSHLKIDLVYAHNDRMAAGAYDAASRYGRADDIRFVGTDALSEGVESILDKRLDATFIYPTSGDSVLMLALKILNNQPYCRESLLKTSLVDSSNANVMKMQMSHIAALDRKIEALSGKLDQYLIRYMNQRMVLFSSLLVLVLAVGLLVVVYISLRTKNRLNKELSRRQEMLENQKQQLEEQKSQLERLFHELEAATHAKQVFFTNISHDFRTPLTLIVDPIDRLLSDSTIGGQSRNMLEMMRRNARILLRMVNQILDFRKVENGRMEFHAEPFDLLSGVRSWSESFYAAMRKKQISFGIEVHSDADFSMMADPEKMERIFFNLLSNAVKYTPDQGTIKVLLMREGDELRLSVFNSGSYISREDAEAVFERFYQLDGHKAGTGIGLALVHAFVGMHGGTIKAESDDAGTTFVITLPQKTAGESLPAPAVSSKNVDTYHVPEQIDVDGVMEEEEPGKDSPTVLIIDDNQDILDYMRSLLSVKYRVLSASDGVTGLRMAVKHIPDIIVSDVVMPCMDGVECCSRLKSEMLTCHIPVILLTACSLDEQRIRGYDGGADSYISKPFDSQLLLSRIRNLLDNRSRLKHVFSEGLMVEKGNLCDMDKSFVSRIKELIEERMPDAALNVEDMGREMGMSRVQLYRKLKSLTNYSPNELLRHMRLKKAAALLSSTEMTVAEIAYRVGFSSPSYFTKCYKEEFGENPTDFLKRNR